MKVKKKEQDIDGRARKLAAELSLGEKISIMSGNAQREEIIQAIQGKRKQHYNEVPYRAGGIPQKGVPPLGFVDGTRGVVCGRGKMTCFPVSVMRGASFDPALEEKIGEAVAEEVREAGGNVFGGVCVNLPYHPGWGRSQETYGEDTCLLGKMGAALVKGVRKRGVAACVKHFAFNSMENVRLSVNIRCSKRAEREVYLPQFKKCIDAGADVVMSAYNSYQGTPCGHHDYLLNSVLKGEWAFRGFVMSDFTWGIKDTAEAVNGGLDMEMPAAYFYGKNLEEAVRRGTVKEEVIEEAAARILTVLSETEKSHRSRRCDLKKHQKLALEAAREGVTLLQNRGGRLPLSPGAGDRKIVVLGYLADRGNTGDQGSSRVYPPYTVTPLEGILRAAGHAEVVYYGGESSAHCRRLAKEADAVIIVAGYDYRDEGEHIAPDPEGAAAGSERAGGDRQNGLGLKERDLAVIRAVASVRSDAVVVLEGGGAITMGEWKDQVAAILMAYYPGMEGGTALGEILFGKVNPSGKLPFAIPADEGDLPKIDWNASEQEYGYFHGYTFLDKKGIRPLFPFGFGLSYTRFEVKNLQVWTEGGRLFARAEVTNQGARKGAEVLQMYVGVPESCVERAVRALKDFRRVALERGETKSVTLSCPLEDLAWYDERQECFVVEEIRYDVYVGTSSGREDLRKESVRYEERHAGAGSIF